VIRPPIDRGGDFYPIEPNTSHVDVNGGRVDEFLSSHPWTCFMCNTVNCEWNKRCIYCWVRYRKVVPKS
jgi:hypothetical protein